MAEKSKAKIIITIIIGLFGIMCFGFALTVTGKYKVVRDKANDLERKFAASKDELLKIPALMGKVIAAEEAAKGAIGEMESLQEELDDAEEELDAITEDLENLQSEAGESTEVAESNDAEEEADVSDSGNENDNNEEIETLKAELAVAETTIADLQSKLSATASAANNTPTPASGSRSIVILGGTFNGMYSVDPLVQKEETVVKELHRGLDYHRTRVLPSKHDVCNECLPRHIIKEQIDVINAKIDELMAYSDNDMTRRNRIGANAYVSNVTKASLEKQSKIACALNVVLANYTNALKTIADCKLYSSRERGQAQNALDKRISSYISALLAKNQSNEFSTNDQDVKLILSKLQTEQKYFLN
ncbi:MAG: hypothetical protein ACUZ8H_07485 [Candidatus Anammoxibacter sp.]